MYLGKELKKLRVGLQLTSLQISQNLNVSELHYKKLESDKIPVSRTLVLNIKKLYGIALIDFDLLDTPLDSTGNRNFEKVKKAQKFYIKYGYTAKLTAQNVGITEQTMGNWIRHYMWNEYRESILKNELDSYLIESLMANPALQILIDKKVKARVAELFAPESLSKKRKSSFK